MCLCTITYYDIGPSSRKGYARGGLVLVGVPGQFSCKVRKYICLSLKSTLSESSWLLKINPILTLFSKSTSMRHARTKIARACSKCSANTRPGSTLQLELANMDKDTRTCPRVARPGGARASSDGAFRRRRRRPPAPDAPPPSSRGPSSLSSIDARYRRRGRAPETSSARCSILLRRKLNSLRRSCSCC